ncbi:hypothetical protein ACMGDK_11545 [Chryseobacterium sp. DT-3]|uniref:hypothetical protein n=1 Tax=Chryseobacterium sp. DT-3 TaxID=3396164 RepID=UPI003F1CB8C1
MTTTLQFFEIPKLILSKPVKKATVKECHTLNYHIITLLTREIVDSLLIFSEKKLISTKDLKYFEKLGNADNDFLFELYKKHGKQNFVYEDFTRVVDFFNKQSDKSLSEFQKSTDPLLKDILATIYELTFIKINITSVSLSLNKLPDSGIMKIVNEKIVELLDLFINRYQLVSNSKEFEFEKFVPIYKKIQKMDHKQFLELTKNF